MEQRNCWPDKAGPQSQMEFGLGGDSGKAEQPCPPRPRRSRAHWWFSRMREVVDEALERPPDLKPVQEALPSTGTHGDGKG
jgi:hypothetical protein